MQCKSVDCGCCNSSLDPGAQCKQRRLSASGKLSSRVVVKTLRIAPDVWCLTGMRDKLRENTQLAINVDFDMGARVGNWVTNASLRGEIDGDIKLMRRAQHPSADIPKQCQ